jgi:SagB-type dehydrogenase family enzyme
MNKKRMLLARTLFVLFLSSLTASNQNFALGHNGENQYENLSDIPVEMVISRRISFKGDYYNLSATVPSQLLSEVLWAAYGHSWRGRTVPSLSGHPIIIYVCNETAAYKFIPENQKLTLWKEGDYRGLSGGYTAPIQLYIAFDTNLCQDVHWGNAESGCPIQNIYLMANSLNLGTVCQGGTWLDRTYIHHGLGLPENEEVLYKMPLGYPLPPYTDYQNLVPTSRPSSPELPEIQDSAISLEYALDSVFSSHEWSENPVTKQELSQVLWASYGYSYYEDTAASPPKRHRTVPSAHAYYPMRIYAADSSGVYQYLPEQHTLTTIVAEDRRLIIAQASGNAWASSAPLIIALAWDDSQILTVDTTYIEVGLIAQNIYLESAAWGLIADWGKADTDEEAMREALGLTEETHLHPASIITIGHPSTYLHKAEWNETIYTVETKTNSTILNFNFDQPNRKISFNVYGSSNTIGFCNVTIPNTLLWGDFTVIVDGNPPTTLVRRDNATHTSLHFTYELLSTRNLQIISEHVIPEFQTSTPIILIFLILTFTIVIYKRKNSGAHL